MEPLHTLYVLLRDVQYMQTNAASNPWEITVAGTKSTTVVTWRL